jgi:RNA-binding protein
MRIVDEMTLHSLRFRAFCQATEDEGKVAQALLFASGADEEDLERTKCVGYHGNPILLLEVVVTKAKMVKIVFLRLSLEDRSELLRTIEDRLDEECTFYFRLDKQEAFLSKIFLGEKEDENDVIAVHGKVKTYPKTRDGALEVMRDFLSSMDR